jgi:hypothetical protein
MKDVRPAKFLVCKTIPCSIDLEAESSEALWAEHNKLAELFKVKLKNKDFNNQLSLHNPDGTLFSAFVVVIIARTASRLLLLTDTRLPITLILPR